MLAQSKKIHTLAGDDAIEVPGLSYLPGFISEAESENLVNFFGTVHPITEQRHLGARQGQQTRRLTRPVYWLGAWQFASLGYYAEPDHVHEKCNRAEPIPPIMNEVLVRLKSRLGQHQEPDNRGSIPNTCLINYYGSEVNQDEKGRVISRDYARLKMHRDGEPGPVVMFSFGQPAVFEFVDPKNPQTPTLSLWLQHRSVVILSGPIYKDYLYHRVTRVKFGAEPTMPQPIDRFQVRRVSVSFRFVPIERILHFREMSVETKTTIRPYLEQLAQKSVFFTSELEDESV